jgi:hypothetical protein
VGKYGAPESHEAHARFIASIPKPEKEGATPEPAPGVVLPVGEVILNYYAHAKRYVREDGTPTGEHETIWAVLRPLRKMFATLPAREFGPKKHKLAVSPEGHILAASIYLDRRILPRDLAARQKNRSHQLRRYQSEFGCRRRGAGRTPDCRRGGNGKPPLSGGRRS